MISNQIYIILDSNNQNHKLTQAHDLKNVKIKFAQYQNILPDTIDLAEMTDIYDLTKKICKLVIQLLKIINIFINIHIIVFPFNIF